MSVSEKQIIPGQEGCLLQICTDTVEHMAANIMSASTLVRYKLTKTFATFLYNLDNHRLFDRIPTRVNTYVASQMDKPNRPDGISIKYLTLEKYDNFPFNMDVIILIGGKYVTSISNDLLDKNAVSVISHDANTHCTKYRIELPFDKVFRGYKYNGCVLDVHILSKALYLNKVEFIFKTTNNVDNVTLICEHQYYSKMKDRDAIHSLSYVLDIMYPSYNYGMSNSKIDILRQGFCMGYYIHYRKPIKNIKMIMWDKLRHDLDAELIDIMCQRINSYTIYMPISPNVNRFSYDINKVFCQARVNKLEFEITTDEATPVCVIAECFVKSKYSQ